MFWNFGNPKTFRFLGLHVHAQVSEDGILEGGNSEARRDDSNRCRRRRLERLCARCRIAAGTHDASCNTRAAAVMRDEVPVTGGDDAPPHGTALANCRCCGGPSAMQHIGCDHACSSQAQKIPQTSPLALVAPQSSRDQPISSFRISGLTMSPPPGR